MMTLRFVCALSGRKKRAASSGSSANERSHGMEYPFPNCAKNRERIIDQPDAKGQPLPRKTTGPRKLPWAGSSRFEVPSKRRGLERQLEPELDEARVVHSRIDRAEAEGIDVVDGHAELRMVEKVEEFRPEVQSHVFPGKGELFDHGEVGVDEIGTYDRDTGRVSELTRSRCDKAGRINPLKLAVVRGVGTAASDLVRTVEVVAIAAGIEGDAGGVGAVDEGNREARSNLLDERELPASKQGVGDPIPVASILLAPAERQIVNEAAGETVVEVDLRQCPIQFLPIWKWEVGRAQQRAKTIGEAIIIGVRIGITDQGVKTILRGLGLGLDLQRVVSGFAKIAELQDSVADPKRRYKSCATGRTSERVTSNGAAGSRANPVRVIRVVGVEVVSR